MALNPDSKTILDSITWGDSRLSITLKWEGIQKYFGLFFIIMKFLTLE